MPGHQTQGPALPGSSFVGLPQESPLKIVNYAKLPGPNPETVTPWFAGWETPQLHQRLSLTRSRAPMTRSGLGDSGFPAHNSCPSSGTPTLLPELVPAGTARPYLAEAPRLQMPWSNLSSWGPPSKHFLVLEDAEGLRAEQTQTTGD